MEKYLNTGFANQFALETTGHTLAATLGFLASHPDEQDAVYNQIMDVVGHDRDPVSQFWL